MSGSDAAGFRQASVLFRQGRFAEAETLLAPLARAHPDDPDVVQALANCHAQLGRYAEAIAGFRRVVEADPTRLSDARKLGVLLEQVGEYTEAARVYREVLAVGDYGDVRDRLRATEATAGPGAPASTADASAAADPTTSRLPDQFAEPVPSASPAVVDPRPDIVVPRHDDGVVVPGATPIQRVVGQWNTTDRGKPYVTANQLIRYRVLTATGAVARAVLVSFLPTAVGLVHDAMNHETRAGTAAAFDVISGVLPYVIVAAWLWAVVKLARAVLYALRYQVVVFERGIDVAEGLLRRSRRFVWYYQLTEEPAFERTALMGLMNAASLTFIYNDTSSTTRHVVLEAIGDADTVETLRRYIEERRLVERTSIRGIVT